MEVMDILQVIAENIEAKDIEGILKLTQHYVTIGKNKNIFTSYLVDLFSQHYMTKNIWILQQFSQKITQIEHCKKNEYLQLIQDLCILFSVLDYKILNLFIKDHCSVLAIKQSANDKLQIETILFTFQKEFDDISNLKETLTPEFYALINILYKNMLDGCDLYNCFIIIRFLIGKKNKELFISDRMGYNAIDIIFIIIIKFLQSTDIIPSDIQEYILLCKDLFYYRCKQKQKLERVNILFYILFVLINRKIKYQIIEYKSNTQIPLVLNNSDYLFVKIPYNMSIIKMVNNDKEFLKLIPKEKKIIEIDKLKERDKCRVNIIKLSS